MSGKFSKKTKQAKARATGKHVKKKASGLWIGLGILTALAAVAVVFLLIATRDAGNQPGEETTVTTEAPAEATESTSTTEPTMQLEEIVEADMNMDNGLEITDIGKYTGVYVEDGSDEIVSGVLMIVVTNTTETDLQYAKIVLTAETGETAEFTLSTLPAGQTAVLLEQNRMVYNKNYVFTKAETVNLAVFSDPLSLHEDLIEIQTVGNAMNVTNISGLDISGDIVIYYKNSSSDMLYGGITYRVRIEGGLKAGEIRQIMPSHFSAEGSRIMFVTVG